MVLIENEKKEKTWVLNKRNCLLYRKNEKQLLARIILYADKIIQFLNLGFETAKQEAMQTILGKDPYTKDYFDKDIFFLM